jgi:hypothetical protein
MKWSDSAGERTAHPPELGERLLPLAAFETNPCPNGNLSVQSDVNCNSPKLSLVVKSLKTWKEINTAPTALATCL